MMYTCPLVLQRCGKAQPVLRMFRAETYLYLLTIEFSIPRFSNNLMVLGSLAITKSDKFSF